MDSLEMVQSQCIQPSYLCSGLLAALRIGWQTSSTGPPMLIALRWKYSFLLSLIFIYFYQFIYIVFTCCVLLPMILRRFAYVDSVLDVLVRRLGSWEFCGIFLCRARKPKTAPGPTEALVRRQKRAQEEAHGQQFLATVWTYPLVN